MQTYHTYLSGWWYTYPSETYESQLGWLFPIYGKVNFMVQTTSYVTWHPKWGLWGSPNSASRKISGLFGPSSSAFGNPKLDCCSSAQNVQKIIHSSCLKRYEKRVRLLWIIEFCWWESPNPHDFFWLEKSNSSTWPPTKRTAWPEPEVSVSVLVKSV